VHHIGEAGTWAETRRLIGLGAGIQGGKTGQAIEWQRLCFRRHHWQGVAGQSVGLQSECKAWSVRLEE